MTPHKLAIGNHPVLESLSGLPVLPDWPETLAPEIQEIIVAFRPEGDNPFLQDTICFRRLENLLEGRKHLLCQVLIHSRHSARLYNRLSESGNEFIPFSLEEGWGRTLFGPGGLVHLDGNGIGYSDNRCLHLVLFGMTTAAEALAMQTLRTAHFPNYVRDHNLRRRKMGGQSDHPDFLNHHPGGKNFHQRETLTSVLPRRDGKDEGYSVPWRRCLPA